MGQPMKSPANSDRVFRSTRLTQHRIIAALVVAVVADGLQLFLGPAGWAFGDQIIDVIAMLLTSWLIGFHWLFLPSFILELIPVADEFPTWTACVIVVTILRRREQKRTPPGSSEKPPIEI